MLLRNVIAGDDIDIVLINTGTVLHKKRKANMSKNIKNEVFTSKVKNKNNYTSKTAPFTRIMAIILAGLMFLGAISYALYFLFGTKSIRDFSTETQPAMIYTV